ncbi:hypothetical protein BKA70DRAFT_1259080 [Coprinopsis sp. MPI-PUGE-AT-0042]|nr:hypothetical protein BKA70DRAFT_1259080 [Coprinopsis sp. MPI-PUGE-AT-0042]
MIPRSSRSRPSTTSRHNLILYCLLLFSTTNMTDQNLTGTFDLYGMELPFLKSVFAPNGPNGQIFPEVLYKEILTFQADDDRTAQITIPEDLSDGEFETEIFFEPLDEEPFHITATNIQQVDNLRVRTPYKRPSVDEWQGPGIKATLEIEDGGCCVDEHSGSVRFRPMWKKVGEDGKVMELYEGRLVMDIRFTPLYARKFYDGQKRDIAFWAVRGEKDSEFE